MCNLLNDTIRAVDIGLVRLPLGEGHLMARVGESGIMGNTVRIEDQDWRQPLLAHFDFQGHREDRREP